LRDVHLPLTGKHQIINLQTALTALEQLSAITLTEQVLRDGIATVTWPGRFQVLRRSPLIVYDVGHNEHSLPPIIRTMLTLAPNRPIHVCLALGIKKQIQRLGFLLAPLGGRVWITEIPHWPSHDAALLAARLTPPVQADRIVVQPDLNRCLSEAVSCLAAGDSLLILGSHYIAPYVYPHFHFLIDNVAG